MFSGMNYLLGHCISVYVLCCLLVFGRKAEEGLKQAFSKGSFGPVLSSVRGTSLESCQ